MVTSVCAGRGGTARAARNVGVSGQAGRRDAVLCGGILWTGAL